MKINDFGERMDKVIFLLLTNYITTFNTWGMDERKAKERIS